MLFHGSITALITPFAGPGATEIDWGALERLVERQIAAGTHGLVPCGTTGESPTLSHEEDRAIVRRVVEVAKGRIPVIAGTGSNCTAEAIALTRHAQEAGADGALIVTPYYNKPTQEGLYAHYRAIHDACAIPIVVYNIPGRCVVDMSVETLARLAADCPRIVGVKDATGDLARVPQVRAACGDAFIQLSGNDDTAPGFLAQGGHGCISVVANLLPEVSAALHNAWAGGDMAAFAAARDALAPLARALFAETSPAPVKYAASVMGLCGPEVRLPLVLPGPATRATLDGLVGGM
ncbi:MAG TPA: 4-hydroxy-tetrahydrodipicolinate synthase [Rhodospirillaceae bacterium]|jgi:4-hydroxy-tetrahydrodipicolinate synthase|nr:4-hydroxy-tetrahydrodipicolinate synthase [Alphaproteobacteria bacterium]HBH26211.1 4-hydroxy-tetrahydrodipicolinate synthase [Rhodospirillaceae bacterium]